jgi:hypothetical protein
VNQPVDGNAPAKPGPGPHLISEHGKGQMHGPQKQPPKPAPTHHTPPSVRDVLHQLMTETAGNAYGWNYREVRPLPIPARLAHGVNADCSYGCVVLCKWAGAPDPTGMGFDGYGNSVSMYQHLEHIPLAQATVGDCLVFGPDGEWHATMIYRPGPDPVLWSHGHQGAPNLYPLSADPRRPVTALRLPV